MIKNNIFGSTSLSDCAGAIKETATENGGGYCNGVGIGANVLGVTIQGNIFHWLEQGMKFYENQGQCYPLNVYNNDYSHIQRIMFETQCNNLTGPMNMNIQYNSMHDRGVPGTQPQQNYDLSIANGCQTPTGNNPANCVPTSTTTLIFRLLPDRLMWAKRYGVEQERLRTTTCFRDISTTESPGLRVGSLSSTTTISIWFRMDLTIQAARQDREDFGTGKIMVRLLLQLAPEILFLTLSPAPRLQ